MTAFETNNETINFESMAALAVFGFITGIMSIGLAVGGLFEAYTSNWWCACALLSFGVGYSHDTLSEVASLIVPRQIWVPEEESDFVHRLLVAFALNALILPCFLIGPIIGLIVALRERRSA